MIGLIVNKILKSSTVLEELVSNRIGILKAAQGEERPYVVINYNVTPSYTKSSVALDEASVDITCSAKNYENCVKVGIAVRDALELYQGVVLGKRVIESKITNIIDDYDSEFDLTNRIITLQIKYK